MRDGSRAREAFRALASRPSADIEMDRAALAIAAEEYPELAVETYLEALDALAARVGRLLHADAGPLEIVSRLNQVLVEEEAFRGNTDNYYDPRNSYLNEVMDRRTGIPITLSLVYMEVARRVGFPLLGVGFPGHFLVKHARTEGDIVLDPFGGGRVLSEDDCRARLQQLFGSEVELEASHLEASSARQMLVRMLQNLKSIYLGKKDDSRALAAVERILLLTPDAPGELRDRGILLSRLRRPVEALAQLSQYRRIWPTAEDGKRVDDLMESLRLSVGSTN